MWRYIVKKEVNCIVCGKKFNKEESRKVTIMLCSDECNNTRKKSLPKKISTTSIEYWTAKGYSELEAKEIISKKQKENSPRSIEYWLKRCSTPEEATIKHKEYQSRNGKKFGELPKETRMKLTPRRLEYWLEKTDDVDEARSLLKNFQDNLSDDVLKSRYKDEWMNKKNSISANLKRARSLDLHIEKYGKDGLEIWKEKYIIDSRKYSSKVADSFFKEIHEWINENYKDFNDSVYYNDDDGNIKEFGILSEDNTYFMYDFVIPNKKICIEFNGSFWHADPSKFSSGDILTIGNKEISVDSIWDKDENKIKEMKNRDFDVLILWYRKNNIEDLKNQTIEFLKKLL